MKLIDDWRNAHKFLSIQAAAIVTILLALQEVAKLFEGVSAFERVVTHPAYQIITLLISAGIILLRLLKQPALEEPETTEPVERAP